MLTIFDDIPSASEVSRQKTKFEVEKDSSTEYKLRVKAEMTEYLPDAAASASAGVAAASVRNEAAASSAAMVASAVACAAVAKAPARNAVLVIPDSDESETAQQGRVAAASCILGEALHDPVDTLGKQEFGIEVGETVKLVYIDKDPQQGFKQFKNQYFTCKVRLFHHNILAICKGVHFISVYLTIPLMNPSAGSLFLYVTPRKTQG